MDITEDKKAHLQKLKAMLVLLLVMVIGVVNLVTPSITVEAKTLSRIEDGRRETSQSNNNAQKYSYLLNGNSSKGFLPDIKNLGKYGYSNKGWGINSPTRNEIEGGGGREFAHSVFPTKTYFHKVNDVEYLRISGTAVAPKYFHMTDKNHRVAILSREDGNNNQIKLWETNLLDLTSSASYDYGYGAIDGNTDWRAAVSQSGHGLIPVHVTNDPYPATAEKASGKGISKYFDNNYGSMFGVNSFNTNQVAKLCGLGSVGNQLADEWNSNWTMKKHGCNYIMDYTGFVVDIPVNSLVSSADKSHTYDFNILLTMTTPNGKEARVYGKTLQIPGVPKNTTTVVDAFEGYEGKVELAPSDLGKVKYTPSADALRTFKKAGNFTANLYAKDTNQVAPNKQTRTGTYGFNASTSNPRFVAWGANRFGSSTWNEINKNKNSVDFVENTAYGRGDMWVGWSMPSISKHKLYTSVGNAYDTMPSATMTYKPQTKVKPVVIRHRTIKNGDYRNPGTVFKTETKSVKRSGGSVTSKPLTGSSLTSLGSNMVYLGKSRIGGDPINDAVTNISTSGVTLSNQQLFSSEYGGDGTLYIDFYYSGTPKDTPEGTNMYDILYDVEHREKGTNKVILKGETGRVKSGQTHTVSAIRPNGYVTTNEFKVDNGAIRRGSSYSIENSGDKPAKVSVVFYYEQREMDIVVEHKNAVTGRNIAKTETGESVVIGETYLATPLKNNQLNGYTYSNKFKLNGGNPQTGANYRVTYNDEADVATVTFLYDWNEPEMTTKEHQNMPFDIYYNAGIVTERDASGKVTGTRLDANTSAVLNTYEAPIALKFTGGSIRMGDARSDMPTNETLIINDEYLNSIDVDSRLGNSVDANGFNTADVNLTNSGYKMSTGTMSSMEEVREEGLGLSGAEFGDTETSNYVGRWVDSNKRNLRNWTPMGVMSTGLTYTGDINALTTINYSYTASIYNKLKHNYESRVGKDGLEYYQYTGSEVKIGTYDIAEDGTVTDKNGSVVSISIPLDIKDMKVGQYVDSEGFKNGTGQIAPTQSQIAVERFNDGRTQGRGYTTKTVDTEGSLDVVKESDGYKETATPGENPRVEYYEEFAYAPKHTEDALITQQAIPVGGNVAYVNPYEYALLPEYGTSSVMEKSGLTKTEIRNNVVDFKSTDDFKSELVFDPTHTGYYVSAKDEFDTFNMAQATNENKSFMDNKLQSSKQHSVTKVSTSTVYKQYDMNVRGRQARYTPQGAVLSTGQFKYKQPITYVSGLRELMLEDVVAVGKDTGFPVVGDASTLEATYRQNYKTEFGVEPSKTDKLITTNNGSVYLVPLNGDNDLEDTYKTRLYVNGIGVSQLHLVDDSELEVGKYLYGRGENTIYSGQRKEIEVDGEFNVDQEVRKGAKPEEATQVNGVRTGNNSEINEKVLDDE